MRHRARSSNSKVLGLYTTLGMTSCGEHVVVVELSNGFKHHDRVCLLSGSRTPITPVH